MAPESFDFEIPKRVISQIHEDFDKNSQSAFKNFANPGVNLVNLCRITTI